MNKRLLPMKNNTLQTLTKWAASPKELRVISFYATKVHSNLPTWARKHVDFCDLEQAGMIALWECSKKYDACRGASLATYATQRIRGAMIDTVRQFSPFPHRITRCKEPLQHVEMREDDEPCAELDTDLIDLHNKIDAIHDKKNKRIVKKWLRGHGQLGIGAEEGVSEGRVSQILKKTTGELKTWY